MCYLFLLGEGCYKMDLEKVGKFITELRKARGLTQAQLGKRLGVTDKTVYKWEKALIAPNISILNNLSRELGVTTTELLNGEEVKKINPFRFNQSIHSNIDFYTQISENKYNKKIKLFLLLFKLSFFFLIIVLLLIIILIITVL